MVKSTKPCVLSDGDERTLNPSLHVWSIIPVLYRLPHHEYGELHVVEPKNTVDLFCVHASFNTRSAFTVSKTQGLVRFPAMTQASPAIGVILLTGYGAATYFPFAIAPD
jgi:hypothetical protein